MENQSVENNLGGRPTKYQKAFNRQAYKLCLLGATDRELADFFEVNVDTIHTWKTVHKGFSDSLKRGKSKADAIVAEALYKKAIGYSRNELDFRTIKERIVKVKVSRYYPPDTTAAIFWLKNRQKDKWRDKQVIDFGFDNMTDDQLQLIVDKLKYLAYDKRRKD
jgi:hypothetical protein